MDGIIEQLIASFDWAYMLSVNVLTYSIIKIIDIINKEKDVSVLIKRIVLICCILGLGITYKLVSDIDAKVLIDSAILAPVAWDFVFRPIIKKLNIGYKEDEKY